MSTIIETVELKKVYGTRGVELPVLRGINLCVDQGEFLGIMGPSGSGKTTLLNLLSTIDTKTSGRILFNGQDLDRFNNKALSIFRRRHIGFIFQDYNLLDNMTVEDNISLPLALDNASVRIIQEKVARLSDFFGIGDHLKKYPYQLSGGQKQRVAAARALITSPTVIFADEPTGALDSKSSGELLNCLAAMNEKFQTVIIMVTHDAFAASFCKRVLFLSDGQIHAKITSNYSRKELYQKILAMMVSLGGGEQNELF